MSAKKILLVDDDPELCELLKQYLIKYNFEVFVAADGARMRQIFSEESVDLIILDVMYYLSHSYD